MNQTEATEAVTKYGSIRAASIALRMPRTTFSDILKGRTTNPRARTRVTMDPGTSFGQTASEFRQLYDKDTIIPQRIRDTLKLLGPRKWVDEPVFARQAKVSLADLGNYRTAFVEYVVNINSRRIWAGSPDFAQELRSML